MILGFDTSNYTTSAALLDECGGVVLDNRVLLGVKEGERGLRQSDAVFMHIKNIERVTKGLGKYKITAIGVSNKPRPLPESYMPCFLAGRACACALSNALGVPLYEFSHQEGHIAAAMWGNEALFDADNFLCVHMSGGTTEILSARKNEIGFEASIVGGTLDISVGQLIDRIGVLLGFAFPCGAQMDKIYAPIAHEKLRVVPKDAYFNLSGIETKLAREIKSGEADKIKIIASVFDCVSDTLATAVVQAAKMSGANGVLFCGGVSASANIRARIAEKLSAEGVNSAFSEAGMSADNAVGIARLALAQWKEDYGIGK